LTNRRAVTWPVELKPSPRGTCFTLVVSVATGLLFGLLPALAPRFNAGCSVLHGTSSQDFEIEGQPASKGAPLPTVDVTVADLNYFQTVRQPLVKGRYFTARDDESAAVVAPINETMVRHRWPNEDPIGKRITFDRKTWITMEGVVGDTREYGLRHPTGIDPLQALRQE
jgi:hypothetical protein